MHPIKALTSVTKFLFVMPLPSYPSTIMTMEQTELVYAPEIYNLHLVTSEFKQTVAFVDQTFMLYLVFSKAIE